MTRPVRPLAAGLLLLLAASPAAGQPEPPADWVSAYGRQHPLAGRLWSPAEQAFVSAETLAARAAAADYVLVGEKHDNADHHRLQAWAIEALAARGRRPAVALEMLGPEQRPALRAHLRAHPRDAAGLGPAVKWEERGWPDWSIYRPLAEAVLAAGLPIVPAQPARKHLEAVSGGGLEALPADLRARLHLDAPLPAALRADLRRQLAESHCHMLPDKALGPMAKVQRLRDAGMADSLIAAAEGEADGAVLITGAGHARLDRAVPWYLRARRPEASILSVALFEVWPDMRAPADYLPPAPTAEPSFDVLWFTPRLDNEDPCETFAEQLERARERHGETGE